jgi:manganese transport protein
LQAESASTSHRVATPGDVLPGEERVFEAAQRALAGERRGLRAVWPFLGPAFIASVAYVDPGNFATNFAGGSKYGYLLLWVILTSNLMAMLIQSLSAKLGFATRLNLAEVCRERFPRPVTFALWIQAEVIAMATDLAEFIGAALGLHLVFGVPLFAAGLITGAFAFLILALQSRGFRPLEAAIAGMVGVILAGFAFQVVLAEPDVSEAATGLVPRFADSESVLLAVGILGATVMPHVIWLHSALTQRRIVGADDEAKRKIYRFERVDVVIAMTIAGVINMSMLITALTVIAVGVNASSALVLSQVVLSFGIPFALVPLVLFSRDRELMGALVNRRITTLAASVVAALIISLNVVLLYLTFTG